MIRYSEYTLPNGLRVILHQDESSNLCALNISYKAGSKYDPPGKTGLAHLLEHLMFAGSKHVPDFDEPQQMAGGENNAVTNADHTHYYQIVPAQNIDIALWLEADRMFHLNLDEKNVEIQRSVVIEEYNETCLNVPFGDVWHHLAPLCYKTHGYSWPTIGRSIDEIKSIKRSDLLTFYNTYYHPKNAVLAISGPAPDHVVLAKLNKYFGESKVDLIRSETPPEIEQSAPRIKVVSSPIPSSLVYLAFSIPDRLSYGYYVADLITDILANGTSAILFEELLYKRAIFSHIDAYITGTDDPGLLIIEGRLQLPHTPEDGIAAIFDILNRLKTEPVSTRELQKWINKLATSYLLSESKPLAKAINLAQMGLLEKTDLINAEIEIYKKISVEDIMEWCGRIFDRSHTNTLIYQNNKEQENGI